MKDDPLYLLLEKIKSASQPHQPYIVLLLPALMYANAYIYDAAYLQHYQISRTFVGVDIPTLIASAIGTLIFSGLAYFLIGISRVWSASNNVNRRAIIILKVVCLITAASLLWVSYIHANYLRPLLLVAFLLLAAYGIFDVLLVELIGGGHKKIAGSKNGTKGKDTTKAALIVYGLAIIATSISYLLGDNAANTRHNLPAFQSKGNVYAIIKTDGAIYLTQKYDSFHDRLDTLRTYTFPVDDQYVITNVHIE